ncbi:MAG: outer membrane protein assembly factor BamA [Kiritimatiellae bacterium]|nr:outer membrane protein assembly factor BamA [Kiritimatiellia bacterium]
MKKTIALLAIVGASAYAATVTNVKVKALDGYGGDTSSVLARCQTKEGSVYDEVTLTRDVTSLKDSGEFQDIRVDARRTDDGVEVTFEVWRKLRFQGPLVVNGNEVVSTSKITSESGLKSGRLYGTGELAEAADKVRELYKRKGYPDAKVSPVPKVMPGGNDATVTFLIDEGAEVDVGEWKFDGAESFDAAELKVAADILPWWNPKGWFMDDPASPDELAQAAEKVKTFYADHGYLDAQVTPPKREPGEDGKTDMVFGVSEGPRYVVGDVSVTGVTRYPVSEVIAKSDLPKAGDVASAKELAEAAHRIEVVVGSGDSGLADSHVVDRRIPRGDENNTVDIVFAVTEGVPVVINQVRIEGNDYTKDNVIRREIHLGPGDRMLADRAEQYKKRLENLDYFSRVRYYLRETDKGKDANGAEYRDLVYEVDEKNTGSFMVGVAASSVDSVYVYGEVQQSNFDLFAPGKLFRGAGQKGRVSVQAGPRIQTYEASVTEPHLFGRLLELTVEGYRRQRWYDEYDIIRSGGAVTLSYPVKFWPTWKPFGSFGVRGTVEFIEFDDIEHGDWWYDGHVVSLDKEEDDYGDAVEAVARFFWTRDTRDSFRMPTTGMRSQVFVDIAGGDNEYWRAGFSHRSYFTVWERYRHVLMMAVRAETIDAFSDEVPIYDRMFLGGPKTVRGVEYRHVSPFARKYRDDELKNDYMPWGGQTLFCANLEYTIPIVRMLRLAAFTDMGAVGEDEFDFDISDTFAWTCGLGIRLDIPMFPIRLDFATPIEKPDHADKEVFSFTIGYDF